MDNENRFMSDFKPNIGARIGVGKGPKTRAVRGENKVDFQRGQSA